MRSAIFEMQKLDATIYTSCGENIGYTADSSYVLGRVILLFGEQLVCLRALRLDGMTIHELQSRVECCEEKISQEISGQFFGKIFRFTEGSGVSEMSLEDYQKALVA